jgi:hypothetical protein
MSTLLFSCFPAFSITLALLDQNYLDLYQQASDIIEATGENKSKIYDKYFYSLTFPEKVK